MTGHRRNIDDLQGEIQELFADLWQVPRFSGLRPGFRPQCDCYRTDDPPTLHVVVELPGVDLGDARGRRGRPVGRRSPASESDRRAPAARYLAMEIDYGAVQAPPRARRGDRPVARDRDLRPRDAQGDAADRGAPARLRRRADRGDPALTDEEYQVVVSAEEQQRAEELGDELPATLPVLPLKETVVFPESMTPLAIGQERSIRLIDDVVGGDRLLALVTVQDEDADTPGFDDLYEIGTAAVVHKMIRVPDGTLRVLVQGIRRVRLVRAGRATIRISSASSWSSRTRSRRRRRSRR